MDRSDKTLKLLIFFIVFWSWVHLDVSHAQYSPHDEMHGSEFEEGSHGGSPPDLFGGPREGESAPNFRLKTLDGRRAELAQYLGKQPVVLEMGSYTCPIFRQKHPALEDLYVKYRNQATFLVIYTTEAHPQGDSSPYSGREWVTSDNQRRGILYRQPMTESDRRNLADKARRDLGINVPIAIDDMQNSAWKAYGSAPNAVYLIGADGQIKLRQGWFEPNELESAMVRELKK